MTHEDLMVVLARLRIIESTLKTVCFALPEEVYSGLIQGLEMPGPTDDHPDLAEEIDARRQQFAHDLRAMRQPMDNS